MSLSVGDTIGDYRILEEIGRGGMGRVFRVEHAITRRVEALKVLMGGRPEAPQEAARSLREIQLQASLNHPNIAAVHNAFWHDENLILVMELIEGCSLRAVLEAGRVPLTTTLKYAHQALSALSYAHENGVIHRDISPANIMIDHAGVLKLTDFGLAKGPGDARLSQTGAPLGSLWYMSPEQVRGATSEARSDIYSLGAVLYELTLGKKPFDGESAFAIMAEQVGTPPTPPIEVDPNVPPAFSAAILQALEKDPNRRFQTAAEFQEVVTRIRSSMNASTGMSPPTPASFWTLWARPAVLSLLLLATSISSPRWLRPPMSVPPSTNLEARAESTMRDNIEPRRADSTSPVTPVNKGVHKPAKSGPSFFRKVLKPIWPLQKRDKPSPGDRHASRDEANQ